MLPFFRTTLARLHKQTRHIQKLSDIPDVSLNLSCQDKSTQSMAAQVSWPFRDKWLLWQCPISHLFMIHYLLLATKKHFIKKSLRNGSLYYMHTMHVIQGTISLRCLTDYVTRHEKVKDTYLMEKVKSNVTYNGISSCFFLYGVCAKTLYNFIYLYIFM